MTIAKCLPITPRVCLRSYVSVALFPPDLGTLSASICFLRAPSFAKAVSAGSWQLLSRGNLLMAFFRPNCFGRVPLPSPIRFNIFLSAFVPTSLSIHSFATSVHRTRSSILRAKWTRHMDSITKIHPEHCIVRSSTHVRNILVSFAFVVPWRMPSASDRSSFYMNCSVLRPTWVTVGMETCWNDSHRAAERGYGSKTRQRDRETPDITRLHLQMIVRLT